MLQRNPVFKDGKDKLRRPGMALLANTVSRASEVPKAPEDVTKHLGVERIEIELGSSLVPLALPEEGGDLAQRIGGVRAQIAREIGIVLPTVRIRDNMYLRPNQYQIKVKGAVLGAHDLMPQCVLALASGLPMPYLKGVDTIEPALGTPAKWIARSLKERAEMMGYITADPAIVLITHLTEVIKGHAAELLTRQETQKLIEHVKHTDEAAVNELIPNLLTLGEGQKVMQALLRERVGIGDLVTVMEVLADHAGYTKDTDALVGYARAALARQICKQYQDEDGLLGVITLAPSLEQLLRNATQPTPTGAMLAVEPELTQQMIHEIIAQIEQAGDQGYDPVLLCSGQIRLPLKRLIECSLPGLALLAYTEIVPRVEVESLGVVSVIGCDSP